MGTLSNCTFSNIALLILLLFSILHFQLEIAFTSNLITAKRRRKQRDYRYYNNWKQIKTRKKKDNNKLILKRQERRLTAIT